jgi:DNA-directed RNA polymerase specialized sigma24 family protein
MHPNADDLLQDVFLQIDQKCAAFGTTKGSALSWIVRATYRAAISRQYYQTSRHFYTQLELEDAAPRVLAPASDHPRI